MGGRAAHPANIYPSESLDTPTILSLRPLFQHIKIQLNPLSANNLDPHSAMGDLCGTII